MMPLTGRTENSLQSMNHVYPLNDEREHITTGTSCWCNPTLKPAKNGAEEDILVHNAADCREVIEKAEEINDKQ